LDQLPIWAMSWPAGCGIVLDRLVVVIATKNTLQE